MKSNSRIVGLDTTALVAFHIASHRHHTEARDAVSSIVKGGGRLALCPVVLDEFVHITTDVRRFERPLSMSVAVNCLDRMLSGKETMLVLPTQSSVAQQWGWMTEHRLGRKRIHDTEIAAIYSGQGIREIMTTNERDFRIFDGFTILDWIHA